MEKRDADKREIRDKDTREIRYEKIGAAAQQMPYELLRVNIECNARCLFCNIPHESYPFAQCTTFQAKKAIAALAKRPHVRLDISGGEPTLRGDLPQLVRHAKQKGVETVQVQTNAILLSRPSYTDRLRHAGLDKIFVGFHSHRQDVHEYLVGVKGAFSQCLKGIENALSSGIEVVLNPVITSVNFRDMPGFIRYVHKNFPQIGFVSLSVVQPRGRAWHNRRLIPRYGCISRYVKKTLDNARSCGITVNNPYCGLPLCIGGWHLYLERCVEYWENFSRARKTSAQNPSLHKIKLPQCGQCRVSRFCNGVWKEYALLYPLCDMKAVR